MGDERGQPGPNLTGKDGHHERNEVVGEGATNTSQTSTGSSSGAGMSREDEDVDARPDLDLSDDPRGGPSMAANVENADRERPPVERSSFAPGGDKVSQPGVEADDIADTSGEDLQRPGAFHERQPRP